MGVALHHGAIGAALGAAFGALTGVAFSLRRA